ncbi:MAG: hypothetical protein DWQ07_00660 [Chloroflexi bacterium]|nr:MAG: hypothetical protein DWQ07_00660 [Chloroflexota bacterium]MBL1195844.1 hypothetical protein [Chloroflexota bacterium]NOH13136.1 hypothetical protein [Chloroflexota bacterium]
MDGPAGRLVEALNSVVDGILNMFAMLFELVAQLINILPQIPRWAIDILLNNPPDITFSPNVTAPNINIDTQLALGTISITLAFLPAVALSLVYPYYVLDKVMNWKSNIDLWDTDRRIYDSQLRLIDLLSFHRYPENDPRKKVELIGYGAAGIFVGIVVGILAPRYLGLNGGWAITLYLMGAAIFCAIGVGSLSSKAWGGMGFGLGLIIFAIFCEIVLLLFGMNANHFIIKILLLIILCASSLLLATYFSMTPQENDNSAKKPRVLERVSFLLAAILAVWEFLNILLDLFGKVI